MDDAQVNAVSSDDEAGTRSALKFLHHLGHRDIAFIRGPESVPSSRARWQPIQSFAQEARIELNQERIVDLEEILHPGSNFEAGAELTMELSRRGRPFTALLAFDDMTALERSQSSEALWYSSPGGVLRDGLWRHSASCIVCARAVDWAAAKGIDGCDCRRDRVGCHRGEESTKEARSKSAQGID